MTIQAEIGVLLNRLLQGLIDPRPSARWAVGRFSEGERLMLITLGVVVQAIFTAIVGMMASEGQQLSPFGALIPLLMLSIAFYGVGSAITSGIARNRGRERSPEAARDIFAWWALVTTLLTPLSVLGFLGFGIMVIIQLFMLVIGIRALAIFIAETYGYEEVMSVVLGIVGIAILLSIAIVTLLSMLGVVAPSP